MRANKGYEQDPWFTVLAGSPLQPIDRGGGNIPVILCVAGLPRAEDRRQFGRSGKIGHRFALQSLRPALAIVGQVHWQQLLAETGVIRRRTVMLLADRDDRMPPVAQSMHPALLLAVIRFSR
jgi:hypothetical protein